MLGDIFAEFEQKRQERELSIEQVKEDLKPYVNKIVLYGAGSAGIAFLYYLREIGIYPSFFADGNVKRWGDLCEEILILSPESIVKEVGKDALVIVTINTDGEKYCKNFDETLRMGGHGGVHKMLRDVGCNNVIDYTYFRRCYNLFKGDKYNLPSCSDIDCMMKHVDDMMEIYSALGDDMSREVFEKIIAFRLLDDTIKIPTLSQDNQYFEQDFYHPKKQEGFVDCGAYNGITLKTFLNQRKENSFEYYAFEPDMENRIQLECYVQSLSPTIQKNIHVYGDAVYDNQCEQSFYSLGGPGSFLADIGEKSVSTVTIDQVLAGELVTFIKMNIEGAEIQALEGAKNTIRRNQPFLAIAGYHKTWDLWQVPQKILEYSKDYRIYLRSYMNHISFVYYAVPKGRGEKA